MRDFVEAGREIGELIKDKNMAYGNSFNETGDILKILYPSGMTCEDYDNVLAITRILDKIFRIATEESAFSEEPWKDICGYALLMVCKKGEKDE